MRVCHSIAVKVRDAAGKTIGTLSVSLPGQASANTTPPPLIDMTDDPTLDPALAPVQLLEGAEYRYAFEPDLGLDVPIILEPREIFSPDTADWRTGRMRPGLYTGTLPIVVLSGDQEVGRAVVEVRSRKLDYLSQYQWMLEEIADSMAELVMKRFAPTEQRFRLDESTDAATLYARFAMLKWLFSGESFEAAIQQILSYPHRAWMDEMEYRRPGQPIRMSSRVAQRLSQPGPRIACDTGLLLPALPKEIAVLRTESTLDTPENRFVKFVLLHWQHFTHEVASALLREPATAPVKRGLREVQAVSEKLQTVLASGLFREVGDLTFLPSGSQVLQKRSGYRDIYRAYLQFEAAALLTWDGGEDVYGAGKRDVATLYEYWVFIQLIKVMERLCGREFDLSQLIELRPDGMGVSLRRGKSRRLKGQINRLGRTLHIELWFNRTFGHRTGNRGSWSRPMRPDYSILIKPDTTYGEPDEVWIHFDAKYRVDSITGLFGDDPITEEGEARLLDEEQSAEARQVSKRADLLKMHAYRDAIRRSAGAYVIYPGTERELLPRFHELLPGLGAFALRPTRDGKGTGLEGLLEFIDDVLTHVATQTTQHERARYWLRESVRDDYHVAAHPAVPFLSKPPADTIVLLGYVRSPEQLRWIHQQRLYNMRTGGRRGSVLPGSKVLAAELVVLYGPHMETAEVWRVGGMSLVLSEHEMRELGYPNPHGRYVCVPLENTPDVAWLADLTSERVTTVKARTNPLARFGEPVATTWLQLLR